MSTCVEIGVTEGAPRHRARRRRRAPWWSTRPCAECRLLTSRAFEEAINVTQNRSAAAAGLLAAGVLVLSACSNSHATLAYTAGAKVDCGGKQELTASGSTAQANAMTRFIDA